MDLRTETILQTLSLVPEGKVTTYGALAKQAGYPGNARLVGFILKRLPANTTLPWHRVLNSRGQISFPEMSPEFLIQKARLEQEGIIFSNNTCSLKKYSWSR